MSHPKVVIIGGGPTGLGAAWRLHELGHDAWLLFEAASQPGGLAGSIVDEAGFTWDFGCHVLHSHYSYVDAVVSRLLAEDLVEQQRRAWIWNQGAWVPYPFQQNFWRLPQREAQRCLNGLIKAREKNRCSHPPSNFDEWMERSYGAALCDAFMRPYNQKVWAFPPSDLGTAWVGERVAPVDMEELLAGFAGRGTAVHWGPNARYTVARTGGAGELWRRLCSSLPADRVRLGRRVTAVRTRRHTVVVEGREEVPYDYLLSSIPVDRLLAMIRDAPDLSAQAARFVHSSAHIVGIGLEGSPPEALRETSWVYVPDPEYPFHRITVPSNLSPFNVPGPGKHWSLLAEISGSRRKRVDRRTVVGDSVAGLVACGFIPGSEQIVSRWYHRLEYAYPTPWLSRDKILTSVLDALQAHAIYSRGRFGAWKYEVANQDHSFMQGVEFANLAMLAWPERTVNGVVSAPPCAWAGSVTDKPDETHI